MAALPTPLFGGQSQSQSQSQPKAATSFAQEDVRVPTAPAGGGRTAPAGGGRTHQTGSTMPSAESEITTIKQAIQLVSDLLERQLERGVERGAGPNEIIEGDGAARQAFYTLLVDEQQRRLFLRVAERPRFWPRLRGLFGCPPYAFLLFGDADTLRAAGIAPRRSNIAHEVRPTASANHQFGDGHLEDAVGRKYRVVTDPRRSRHLEDDGPLPWRSLGREIVLQVKRKPRSRGTTTTLAVDFPRVGDSITLRENPRLVRLTRGQKTDTASPVVLKVLRLVQRSEHCTTAAVVCVPK